MIQLDNLRDLLEPLLELSDFLEVITKLDNRCGLEHPLLVDDKLTVLQRVNVALDEEQVGTTLDGQETATRNVDTMGVVEVLDGSTSSSLELQPNETLHFGNHVFKIRHT